LNRSTAVVVAFTLLTAAAAFLLPAVPQPLDYHDFATSAAYSGFTTSRRRFERRLPAGRTRRLFVVFSGRARFEFPAERWPYAVFFLGILLTAAGSAYYHLSPDNETLFWTGCR